VVFIVGFVYLLWKKKMSRDMIRPLILLFLLGALQGAVGWIMVASGLTGDAIYVAPTRLAIHFVLALGLICYAFWFALQLTVPPESLVGCSRLRKWTWAILATVFFQLLFGALMAGHQAALAAPTWPTINGDWVPSSLFAKSPLYLNFINNPLTIHFVHRGLAYVILAQTLCWTWAACSRNNPSWDPFRRYRTMPLILVSAQVLLGISTVLSGARIVANHWGAFEWLALLHQVTGMLFLLCMVGALFMVRTDRPGSPV
jgi:cytochrome c oxidase assembly protein subunit 15